MGTYSISTRFLEGPPSRGNDLCLTALEREMEKGSITFLLVLGDWGQKQLEYRFSNAHSAYEGRRVEINARAQRRTCGLSGIY